MLRRLGAVLAGLALFAPLVLGSVAALGIAHAYGAVGFGDLGG